MRINSRGLSLFDLIISIVLLIGILLAASNLLITFGRMSFNAGQDLATASEATMIVFDELSSRALESNLLQIPVTGVAGITNTVNADNTHTSFAVRVSPTGPATTSHTNDTTHYYWKLDDTLKYKSCVGTICSNDSTIVKNVDGVHFSYVPDRPNQVKMQVDLSTDGRTETLFTVVTARGRNAQG